MLFLLLKIFEVTFDRPSKSFNLCRLALTSGVYIYRLQLENDLQLSRKMTLVK